MFLQMEDINKTYQSGSTTFQALKNVGFSMEQGQICVILGPSGSGKSTLMNIIGGIDNADSGSIHVADWELNDLKEKQLTQYRRDAVGFIFQFYNLVPNLTARENVELTTNISKNPLNIDEILDKILKKLKILRNLYPNFTTRVNIWKGYAISSLLYQSEVIVITKTQIEKFELSSQTISTTKKYTPYPTSKKSKLKQK